MPTLAEKIDSRESTAGDCQKPSVTMHCILDGTAGNATDRMANGIDKIERNTRPLRDADELIFT